MFSLDLLALACLLQSAGKSEDEFWDHKGLLLCVCRTPLGSSKQPFFVLVICLYHVLIAHEEELKMKWV